jgi:hypothetical protein
VNNHGVRIRVLGDQARGNRGGIRGPFVLLDAGNNKHADALRPLVGRETNAEEILGVIRRDSPSCVSVANANILVPEEDPQGERHDGGGHSPAAPEGQ